MYTLRRFVLFWIFIANGGLYVPIINGLVLEVPLEYSTIQSALDTAEESDTVRVAPGVYHEFLSCQTNFLTLTGWYSGDTLAEFQTLLDPIPEGLDTPSAVVFSGDSVTVNNFAFFNRIELRQNIFAERVGGIRQSNVLILQNCRFDSVLKAVNGGTSINATNCKFVGCLRLCINPFAFGSVQAESCYFDGDGPWLVHCSSNSSIRNCHFLCNALQSDLMHFFGENIEIIGCRFGPCYNTFPILRGYTQGNCRIENCVFEGIERASSLIEIAMPCPGPEGIPITIRGNTFRNYQAEPPAQGTPAIRLLPQSPSDCYFGIIECNEFRDGTSILSAGIIAAGSVDVENNIFENLGPDNSSDIYAYRFPFDTIFARNNQFLEPGIAATSESPYFDARENWWGDSTGPYHQNLNPNGQGTEVGNGVLFVPWLTQPADSNLDSNGVAIDDDQSILHPSSFILAAYPNPFNATTTLHVEVARAGEYLVKLFDVSGREVAVLFGGRIELRAEVRVDASGLASGVYFAVLQDQRSNFAVSKLLFLK